MSHSDTHTHTPLGTDKYIQTGKRTNMRLGKHINTHIHTIEHINTHTIGPHTQADTDTHTYRWDTDGSKQTHTHRCQWAQIQYVETSRPASMDSLQAIQPDMSPI